MNDAEDLWLALGGSADSNDREAVAAGRVLLTVNSDCGRRLARVHAADESAVAVIGDVRLTRRHTATVLADAALEDLESDPEGADGSLFLDLVDRLFGDDLSGLPALTIPGRTIDVPRLVTQESGPRIESFRAERTNEHGVVVGRPRVTRCCDCGEQTIEG